MTAPLDGILGQSAVLQELLDELALLAETQLPVLLLGETGVGKELFARRLHRLSQRGNKPLVQVNCAALPEALAEASCSVTSRGPSPAPPTTAPGGSMRPTAAPCSSMRSANCP